MRIKLYFQKTVSVDASNSAGAPVRLHSLTEQDAVSKGRIDGWNFPQSSDNDINQTEGERADFGKKAWRKYKERNNDN